jgi:hypothetical protein
MIEGEVCTERCPKHTSGACIVRIGTEHNGPVGARRHGHSDEVGLMSGEKCNLENHLITHEWGGGRPDEFHLYCDQPGGGILYTLSADEYDQRWTGFRKAEREGKP